MIYDQYEESADFSLTSKNKKLNNFNTLNKKTKIDKQNIYNSKHIRKTLNNLNRNAKEQGCGRKKIQKNKT
jgi:hypothetical protein